MSEATKTAELASPPRKAKWKRWAIALACVLAAATIALLASAPKPKQVKVWFVRATNEAGVKKLVFEGTNGRRGGIGLVVCIVPGVIGEHKNPDDGFQVLSWTNTTVARGTNSYFTLEPPAKGVSYYVAWSFYHTPPPPAAWVKFRVACWRYFSTHSMPRLARYFAFKAEMHYIPSTEIKE